MTNTTLFNRYAAVIDLYKAAQKLSKVDRVYADEIYDILFSMSLELIDDIEDAGWTSISYYTKLCAINKIADEER